MQELTVRRTSMNVIMSTVRMVEHVLMDWVPILVLVYKVILVPTVR